MPTIRTHLPTDTRPDNLKIKRVPPRGNLQGICLAPELTVVDTHYWHGRTCPCERELNADGFTIDDAACEPCQQKQGYRPHVYIPVWEPSSQTRYLLEITTHAAKPLADYLDAHGTLRGCAIYAFRPKGIANGAVVIQTSPVNQTITHLPAAPNVTAALAILWRLPATAFTSALAAEPEIRTPDNHATPVTKSRVRPAALAAMRTQTDDPGIPQRIGEILAGNGKPK
jgi:hypothetical protein